MLSTCCGLKCRLKVPSCGKVENWVENIDKLIFLSSSCKNNDIELHYDGSNHTLSYTVWQGVCSVTRVKAHSTVCSMQQACHRARHCPVLTCLPCLIPRCCCLFLLHIPPLWYWSENDLTVMLKMFMGPKCQGQATGTGFRTRHSSDTPGCDKEAFRCHETIQLGRAS